MYRKLHNLSQTNIAILAVVFTAGNLSTSLSRVARLAAHPKFVWFSTPTVVVVY
jgi:hypothetical protein